MSEQMTTTDDFAKMLEESFVDAPKLEKGAQIEGKVINITASHVFIGLGGKQDAIADFAEYEKDDLKIGDTVKGFIVSISDSEVIISKSLNSSTAGKSALRDAYEQKIPVTGKVNSAIKGGFSVNVLGVRAFCPISQIDLKFVEDANEFIGKSYNFEVTEYREEGRYTNVVVSRKILLAKEREEKKQKTLAALEVGSVTKAIVKRLAPFGAFVDLGGVDALLPISQISWARVNKVADVLAENQEIEVKIMSLEPNKISVSLKVLQEHPFDNAVKSLDVGQTIRCRIVKNESFGAFAEITPGVEGLIPISQLAKGRRIARPSEVVNVGDLVEAQILTIDAEKRKISLSMKALQPDPWDTIEDRFQEGQLVIGKIENLAQFGAFIQLADGITGLIPASKMKLAGLKLNHNQIGEELTVKIATINLDDNRISLEPENMPEMTDEPNQEKNEPRNYRAQKRENNDWKKYAKEEKEVPEDNPFMNL